VVAILAFAAVLEVIFDVESESAIKASVSVLAHHAHLISPVSSKNKEKKRKKPKILFFYYFQKLLSGTLWQYY
jgi:hypothetical protein